MKQPENRPQKAVIECSQEATGKCTASFARRKYVARLRPETPDELSANITFEGQHAYFPLSTNLEDEATKKGELMRGVVAQAGWRVATSRFIREFTFAIFWLPNPLTCTYTTLFSLISAPTRVARPLASRVRVAVLEPEQEIRWALMDWLDKLPEYECVSAHGTVGSFLKDINTVRPDLVLFNDPPCTPASGQIRKKLTRHHPGLVAFPFGIYSDSDQAWCCVTGVDGGYYYRRRLFSQMFDPIASAWQGNKPNLDTLDLQIRHHVQTLFGLRMAPPDTLPALTSRERDMLMGLRRGHTDKTLATLLNISSWTVHTHMKSLFDKLGVHTRAEAVSKYFDK